MKCEDILQLKQSALATDWFDSFICIVQSIHFRQLY